jgi:hypothetical protein
MEIEDEVVPSLKQMINFSQKEHLEGREAIRQKATNHVLDKSIAMFLDRFSKIFMRILILRTNHFQKKKIQVIRVVLHKTR